MYTAKIKITLDEMNNLGWEIDQDYSHFILTICPSEVTISIAVDTEYHKEPINFNADEYTFDWEDTLSDLNSIDKLHTPFSGLNAVLMDDDNEEISIIVQVSDVSQLLDMSQLELALYYSIEDINDDIIGSGLTLKRPEEEAKYEIL